MVDDITQGKQKSRRQILKLAGAASAGVAGLAGNAAGQEGGDGNETTTTGSGQNLSGVNMQFWDMQHTQSEAAAQMLRESVNAVEQRTGATITPTWGAWDDDGGGKWKQNIASGNRPTVLQGTQEIHGKYITEGWFKPVSEFMGEFSQETADAIQPTLDTFETAYSGFDPAQLYEMPFGTEIGSPFAARVDHFEEAGVDIDNEFPPTSYDEIVELGTTLQENGPGQYGFQIYGSTGDVTDEAPLTWAVTEGGIEGTYLNEEWSDVMYDSSAWKTALSQWVSMFQEHGLSSPNSPSASDETATELLMAGQASLTQISGVDHGMITSSAPQLIENNQIRYAPHWQGESITFFSPCQGVLTPGQNADQQTWERKQQVAYELQKELLSVERQNQLTEAFGIPPTRTDIFDQVTGSDHRLIDSQIQMREQVGGEMLAWAAHPEMLQIKQQIAGAVFQNAVRGQIDPEEACNQAAQQIRNQVELQETYTVPGQ